MIPYPTEPGTDVAQVERPASTAVIMSPDQYDSTWKMAKALAMSGSFKDIGRANMTKEVHDQEASKALARILLGADLGMSPTQALMGIDIVKGNPQIRGVALGRMVRESAKRPTPAGESYDYAVLDRGFEEGAEYAVVALYRKDDDGRWPVVADDDGVTFPTIVGPITIKAGKRLPEAIEAFHLGQAKKRGLIKDGGAWKDQPEVMVIWRALSQLVRFYAPDVIGGMSVYTEADGLRDDKIGAGHGDGSEPGWTIPAELADAAERLIERARERGHAGFTDRASLQQRLNGQPRDVVVQRLGEWTAEVDALPEPTEAEVVAEEVADPPTLTINDVVFTFNDTDDPYAMIEAAMIAGPDAMRDTAGDLAVSSEHVEDAELRARLAALSDALAAEAAKPSDEQERMDV